MRTNFPTKKIFFIILVLNLVALSSYYYLFSNIRGENQAISVLKNVLGGQVSKESKLKFLGASLKDTEKERSVINSYFVQKGKVGVASFVENIESVANLSKVSLKVSSILLKKNEELSVVERMDLNFEIKGSWDKVFKFLSLLERLPYKIYFKRVYIDKNEEASSWNGIFNISVLKLKDN